MARRYAVTTLEGESVRVQEKNGVIVRLQDQALPATQDAARTAAVNAPSAATPPPAERKSVAAAVATPAPIAAPGEKIVRYGDDGPIEV